MEEAAASAREGGHAGMLVHRGGFCVCVRVTCACACSHGQPCTCTCHTCACACAIQHDSAIQRDPTIPCDPVLSDAALSGASPHRTCTTRTSKGLYFAATSGVCLIPSGRLLPDSCPVPAQRPVPFTLPR
jgi:hypothetical protein